MEYFRSFNLDQEPFSNSPDPGLFFESRQHLEALQKLEISIRLKRGLNVVSGDVGTGKTTLSRQLIQKISQDKDIVYSLLLDPGFSSNADFLNTIYRLFEDRPQADLDENSLKEAIKTFLFKKGVDENKTLVLIIDEGQKLPVFCLEILRELLNYETNDQKLLQIVIFAQKEFEPVVASLANFEDRINFRYQLSPLGFSETKALINFRVNQSLMPGETMAFFSFFAYFALFYYTRGYPRKIIHLCHHIILGLIVEDQSRAGFFFVRTCAKKVFLSSPKKIGLLPVCIAVVLGIAALFLYDIPDFVTFKKEVLTESAGIEPVPAPVPKVQEKALDSTPNTAFALDTAAPLPALSSSLIHSDNKIQTSGLVPSKEVYGYIEVTRNFTLSYLVELVYGTFHPQYLSLLLARNTHIENPNFLQPGTRLEFPVIKKTIKAKYMNQFCVVLSRMEDFKSAFAWAAGFKNMSDTARLIHKTDKNGNFIYFVIVNRYFKTLEKARDYIHTEEQISLATAYPVSELISDSRLD